MQMPVIKVHADVSCKDRGLMFGQPSYISILCVGEQRMRICANSPELSRAGPRGVVHGGGGGGGGALEAEGLKRAA